MEATDDPTCWIVERGDGRVVYQNDDGERWEILGECNRCGACEGGEHPPRNLILVGPKGEPGSCIDLDYERRLDRPVRPEIADKFPSCSLRGRYLSGV